MKAYLIYDIPSESEEFNNAVNGSKYAGQLEDVWNLIYRPRGKHGYNDQIINDLLGLNVPESEETEIHKACHLLMDRLELIYQHIKSDD